LTYSKFLVIKARLELELSNIQKLFLELDNRDLITPSDARKQKLDDQFALRAVGSFLHDFYSSVENIFKIIARSIDQSVPVNSELHAELLQQMSLNVDRVRPAVISIKTMNLLNEYRSFRHVFRNIYGFNLITKRLEHLLDIFPSTIDNLKAETTCFISEMEEILS
jgi:hypothetical protein